MSVRRIVFVGAAVVALAVTATIVSGRLSRAAGDTPAGSAAPAGGTAEITRGSLVQTASVDGVLGYGNAQPVTARAAGTVTWLPAPGTTVTRGAALVRVDDLPIVLLYGDLPSYRPLVVGTVGRDVAQLETNLRALGYTGFVVDQRFTAQTADAVRHWQRDLGRPPTGVLDGAAVIYTTGPVRIASQLARPGDTVPGQVLTCTGMSTVVTAQIPARNADWAVNGAPVDVLPPRGGPLRGVITDVGTELPTSTGTGGGDNGRSGGGGSPVVTVTVALADQAPVPGAGQVPVTVLHVVQRRDNVLTVPVSALLAPIEGGYAVQVVTGDRSSLVPVRVGLFADGRVEISGPGLGAGMRVRVPA